MAVEHLKAVMGMTLTGWTVSGSEGSTRRVSAPVRKAVLISMVWQIKVDTDFAYKSIETISEETQLSRRQVQAAVRSLEDEGILKATSVVNGKPWRGISNAYQVILPLERHSAAQANDKGAPTHGRRGATLGQQGATLGQAAYAAHGRPIGSIGIDREVDGFAQQAAKQPCPSGRQHQWGDLPADGVRVCSNCHREEILDAS